MAREGYRPVTDFLSPTKQAEDVGQHSADVTVLI